MSFNNMKAELRRWGITQRQVAESLGMSENNFGLKINERIPMTVEEAKSIRDTWMPKAQLDYLLESDGDVPTERERKLAALDVMDELVDESGTQDVFREVLDEMRAEYAKAD